MAQQRRVGLGKQGTEALVALMLADSPARHVRVVLEHHRRNDVPFDRAWASALRSIPRGDADVDEWREQLRWSRDDFRRAYERVEPESAVLRLPDRPADRHVA